MDKKHEYRVAAGSGAGLALLGMFLPFAWHEMPTLISYPSILMGMALLLWGIWPPIKDRYSPNFFANHASNIDIQLEIIFDITNPNRKFWSLDSIRDEKGNMIGNSYWEYRAVIKNSSSKTLRNVKVIVECIGPMPTRPEYSRFDINKKEVIDLNPNEETLAVIRCWPYPSIFAGMACGEDLYGPIKMIVSADDISPSIKVFHFDPEKTPMVYE